MYNGWIITIGILGVLFLAIGMSLIIFSSIRTIRRRFRNRNLSNKNENIKNPNTYLDPYADIHAIIDNIKAVKDRSIMPSVDDLESFKEIMFDLNLERNTMRRDIYAKLAKGEALNDKEIYDIDLNYYEITRVARMHKELRIRRYGPHSKTTKGLGRRNSVRK